MTSRGFCGGSDGKESASNEGDQGQEDPLEKDLATHSDVLVWRIPWTEKPGGLSPRGHKELDTSEQLTLSFTLASRYCHLPPT